MNTSKMAASATASSGTPAFAPRRSLRAAARAAPALSLPTDVRLMRVTANLLFTLAVLLLAVLALNRLLRLPAFALSAISIDGDVARNSEQTIRANAAPKLAGNFFTADLDVARRAFESVPWVREAVVRRVWPNRLAVHLEEHLPVAIWSDEAAGDKLVNSHGEVFDANLGDVEDDKLPTLAGPPNSAAHLLAVWQQLQPVMKRIDQRIETLSLSGRGSWHAELDNGAELELGRGSDDELVARSERFVATVAHVTQLYHRPLESADLRHADGYAVRLKGITTTLAASGSAFSGPATAAAATIKKN